jgi:hypothetical protein
VFSERESRAERKIVIRELPLSSLVVESVPVVEWPMVAEVAVVATWGLQQSPPRGVLSEFAGWVAVCRSAAEGVSVASSRLEVT